MWFCFMTCFVIGLLFRVFLNQPAWRNRDKGFLLFLCCSVLNWFKIFPESFRHIPVPTGACAELPLIAEYPAAGRIHHQFCRKEKKTFVVACEMAWLGKHFDLPGKGALVRACAYENPKLALGYWLLVIGYIRHSGLKSGNSEAISWLSQEWRIQQ